MSGAAPGNWPTSLMGHRSPLGCPTLYPPRSRQSRVCIFGLILTRSRLTVLAPPISECATDRWVYVGFAPRMLHLLLSGDAAASAEIPYSISETRSERDSNPRGGLPHQPHFHKAYEA